MPLPYLPIDLKKLLAFLLTLVGIGALATGVFELFTGGAIGDGFIWAITVLGLIFFFAGIGLLKSS